MMQLQHGLKTITDVCNFTLYVNFTLFVQMTYKNQLDRTKDDQMGYGIIDRLQTLSF
jgi:hypothetical protein